MKKHLLVALILLACTTPQAFALSPNNITYYDGVVKTVGLGCFDEESCAYMEKAIAENPKLKPYTDYIGKPAKPIIGRIDEGGALQDTGDKWPEGTLIAGQDSNFLHENCFVSFNTDKTMQTIIGIELMNSFENNCDL